MRKTMTKKKTNNKIDKNYKYTYSKEGYICSDDEETMDKIIGNTLDYNIDEFPVKEGTFVTISVIRSMIAVHARPIKVRIKVILERLE